MSHIDAEKLEEPNRGVDVLRSMHPHLLRQLPFEDFRCRTSRQLLRLFTNPHAVPLVAVSPFSESGDERDYLGSLVGWVGVGAASQEQICTIASLKTTCEDEQELFVMRSLLGTLQEIRDERGWKKILASLSMDDENTDPYIAALEAADFGLQKFTAKSYIYSWPQKQNGIAVA